MRIVTIAGLTVGLLAGPIGPAAAQNAPAGGWIDWGGGYLRGPDSASTTVATSGAGANRPAPPVIPPAPPAAAMIDWGGGYLRGPDPASITPATSGAGAPRPPR